MSSKVSNIFKNGPSKEKLKGCLVGAAIGDCLGAPFEGLEYEIKRNEIFRELKLSPDGSTFQGSARQFVFTDDTAMTLSVCRSLIEHKSFNPVDMATRFRDEFYKKKDRGYGQGAMEIFNKWKHDGIKEENVFVPSKAQFNGSGSYGNGAAMRVAPVGLFSDNKEECIQIARNSALLTHSNRKGYTGAILQALAVFYASRMNADTSYTEFLAELKKEIRTIEQYSDKDPRFRSFQQFKSGRRKDNEDLLDDWDLLYNWVRSEEFTYSSQLIAIENLLKQFESSRENFVPAIQRNIGSGISAMEAIPAAIYCFLKNLDKGFKETLFDAISLGYDTDTVGTMACALSGAYHGISSIPVAWIENCEGTEEMIELANKISRLPRENYE